MTTSNGHAINQASVRRLVHRFTYTPKRGDQNVRRPLRIGKQTIDALNAFVLRYATKLYRRQEHFRVVLADADRVRIEQKWLTQHLRLEEGIGAVVVRKQIEQHLTHALVAACNTVLDHGRASVQPQDVVRTLMLTVAILNVQKDG